MANPTIRILLYTDDPETQIDDREFGLGTMVAHLEAHKPAFADLKICLLCRNATQPVPAANRLVEELISQFDEIWFFGFHQINRSGPGGLFLRGTLGSELEDGEVEALTKWMKADNNGGGVMVTGDHSEEAPPDAVQTQVKTCPDSGVETKLGLGRAIGRCVPRAGQLRRWRGEPSNDPSDSFNTQVGVPGIDIDLLKLQLDAVPQRLILRRFNEGGQPARNGQPHPLFSYTSDTWIRVFPDHAHEGAIILPKEDAFTDTETWPKVGAVQPRPYIVAYGIDERDCRLIPLIAVYDGDSADVGRVVGDSSFHHYLNINLRNFGSPAPVGSDADQIGQYYANLAIWLCPRKKRQEMAQLMMSRVASHPSIREEFGNESLTIGRAAYFVLSGVASTCEIHELLQAVMPDDFLGQFQSVFLPERGIPLSAFPSRELILGTMVENFQQRMRAIESSPAVAEEASLATTATREAIGDGIKGAFETQTSLLKQFATAADELTQTLK
jgi:hypothetical protein